MPLRDPIERPRTQVCGPGSMGTPRDMYIGIGTLIVIIILVLLLT
ncbi:MAG TPA: hypothetical protein VGO92_03085 [Acidimicrobiales bacterium]|jgi:type IV secretory pathway TrbD component|nr:hypothetical protein [Acidimicrobiales bacterium]